MRRESKIDPPQIALAIPMRRAFDDGGTAAFVVFVGAACVTRGAYTVHERDSLEPRDLLGARQVESRAREKVRAVAGERSVVAVAAG